MYIFILAVIIGKCEVDVMAGGAADMIAIMIYAFVLQVLLRAHVDAIVGCNR